MTCRLCTNPDCSDESDHESDHEYYNDLRNKRRYALMVTLEFARQDYQDFLDRCSHYYDSPQQESECSFHQARIRNLEWELDKFDAWYK